MKRTSSSVFCLYLWRSLEGPGTRYMATSMDLARAVYTEMCAEGYVVKAVEVGSGREFEMRGGDLVPVPRGTTAAAPAIPAFA